MSDHDIRARLSAAPGGCAPADDGIDFVPGAARLPAAVLVGVTSGPAAGVLLTRRTVHLRRHSGQVSFPGGRIDPGDASPEAAALREAQEEIGLDPVFVEPLGRLPDHYTSTGFIITPVTALLRPGFAAEVFSDEVDAVFTLPLAVLLDPSAPQRRRVEFAGAWREFWVWPHPEYYIWGATAAILVGLATSLK